MSEEQATPVFQIQRVYLKDLSLEQPNSPAILTSTEQPSVDIQLAVGMEQVADGITEVSVTATVTTKIQDKVVFLVEAKQAGIFEIRNMPDGQLEPIQGIAKKLGYEKVHSLNGGLKAWKEANLPVAKA